MSYIDITVPIRNGMVCYPQDPEVLLTPAFDISKGDTANVTRVSFGTHSGTHVDAPYHMIPDGKKADDIPADYFIGKAKVFAFSEDIGLVDVVPLNIEKGDIVLIKTPNSLRMFDDEFCEDYVSLMPEAAAYLVSIGVHAVGIDYLSIENYADKTHQTHRILLGEGIPIIEGLDLSQAEPGVYNMTAMFMRINNSDGSPIRAILEKN